MVASNTDTLVKQPCSPPDTSPKTPNDKPIRSVSTLAPERRRTLRFEGVMTSYTRLPFATSLIFATPPAASKTVSKECPGAPKKSGEPESDVASSPSRCNQTNRKLDFGKGPAQPKKNQAVSIEASRCARIPIPPPFLGTDKENRGAEVVCCSPPPVPYASSPDVPLRRMNAYVPLRRMNADVHCFPSPKRQRKSE